MQFIEPSGRSWAQKVGRPISSADDLFDPSLSIEIGAAYLASLLKQYRGDFVSAAVAYNAGQVKCATAITCPKKNYWGVCTDGSAYPLIAIQNINSAIDHGYPFGTIPYIPTPAPTPQPDAPLPYSTAVPVGIAALSMVGAYLLTNVVKKRYFGSAMARRIATSHRSSGLMPRWTPTW